MARKRLIPIPLALVLACGPLRGSSTPGHRLYLAKCTSCHAEYDPAERSPAAWREVVAEMEAAKRVHLSDEERAQILAYLSRTERPEPPGR